jgi:SAM-dependent methyltransferase
LPRVDLHSFYDSALEVYGATARGVHWNSKDSQETRFLVLRQLLPEDLSGLTIVDAGCGFADLYLYLAAHHHRPGCYLGLELLPTMIEKARERVACEIHACDVLQDPLPAADYYVCSGAMNNLTRAESYRFIERCLAAASQGFVFNLLKGQDDAGIYNCFMPEEIRDFARRIGARCEIVEGYLRNDFSAALRRPERQGINGP